MIEDIVANERRDEAERMIRLFGYERAIEIALDAEEEQIEHDDIRAADYWAEVRRVIEGLQADASAAWASAEVWP